VRSIGGDGLVAVRGGEDASGLVEVGAVEAPVVPGPVDAFVGGAGDAGERRGTRLAAQQLIGDEGADLGWQVR
jgi:hypothetical protein